MSEQAEVHYQAWYLQADGTYSTEPRNPIPRYLLEPSKIFVFNMKENPDGAG